MVKFGDSVVIVSATHVVGNEADISDVSQKLGKRTSFRPLGYDLSVSRPVEGVGLPVRREEVGQNEALRVLTHHNGQNQVIPGRKVGTTGLPGHFLFSPDEGRILPGMSGSLVVDTREQAVGVVVKGSPSIGIIRQIKKV